MLADMTDQPIACTLPVTQVPGRLALVDSLAGDALIDHAPIDGGVRWRFRDAPGIERRVRELAALESECCGFLTFQIARDADAITVEITGAEEARPVIEEFFAVRR
jgi:hypothetical protein